MKYGLLLLGGLSLLPGHVPAGDGEQWMLMARHGECSKIDSLRRKFPDMGQINSPSEFTALMQGKNYQAATKVLDNEGKAVEVNVEAEKLSLIFVRASLCKKIAGGPG